MNSGSKGSSAGYGPGDTLRGRVARIDSKDDTLVFEPID